MPVAARVVQRMLPPAALTGVDVPTERGGAARLDRGHDLETSDVEPSGHALTVSAPGAAEDIRHAGPLARHARSAAKHREARDWVVERLEHPGGGAGVSARRIGAPMPERVADHLHVAAPLVKMGRGRVTQAMEGVPAVDASLVARLLEGPVQGPGLDGHVGRGTVE